MKFTDRWRLFTEITKSLYEPKLAIASLKRPSKYIVKMLKKKYQDCKCWSNSYRVLYFNFAFLSARCKRICPTKKSKYRTMETYIRIPYVGIMDMLCIDAEIDMPISVCSTHRRSNTYILCEWKIPFTEVNSIPIWLFNRMYSLNWTFGMFAANSCVNGSAHFSSSWLPSTTSTWF